MKECKINNLKINARDELTFKVTVKREDYTDVDRELLKQAEINGNLLDISFIGLINGDIEKQNKANLVKLNGMMTTYCDKANLRLTEEVARLYQKYNVTSRRDISASDVESEIENYKFGILELNQ